MILETKETDSTKFFIKLLIKSKDSTTFRSIKHLGSMETCYRNITIVKDTLAFVVHTNRMTCIIDNFQIMFLCNSVNSFNITTITKNMYWHDSNSMIGNFLFNFLWIHSISLRIYINEYRCTSFPKYRINGCNESKRSCDNFPTFGIHSTNSHLKTYGTIYT